MVETASFQPRLPESLRKGPFAAKESCHPLGDESLSLLGEWPVMGEGDSKSQEMKMF